MKGERIIKSIRKEVDAERKRSTKLGAKDQAIFKDQKCYCSDHDEHDAFMAEDEEL